MFVRLLLLLFVAGGLAVYLASKPTTVVTTSAAPTGDDGQSPEEIARIRERQKALHERPLPGSDPKEPAIFGVTVDVNRASGKNQLCFNVTESHGYYCEQFRVEFWYLGDNPATTPEQAKVRNTDFWEDYIKTNETMRRCMELVPAELEGIGGSIGQTGEWMARIIWTNRCRSQNPNPLPPKPGKYGPQVEK